MRSTLDLLRPFTGRRVCVLLAADPFVLSFDPAQAERTIYEKARQAVLYPFG